MIIALYTSGCIHSITSIWKRPSATKIIHCVVGIKGEVQPNTSPRERGFCYDQINDVGLPEESTLRDKTAGELQRLDEWPGKTEWFPEGQCADLQEHWHGLF